MAVSGRRLLRCGVLALAGVPGGSYAVDFQLLRHEDDFLAQREEFPIEYARWKARPVGATRLSLGGEARWRGERTWHPEWTPQADSHAVWTQRYQLFADVRWSHLRVFAQGSDTEAAGRPGGSSPVDESGIEASNLFLELIGGDKTSGVALRHGLQEIRLGSARLVDVREGPNVRRSFRGTRLQAHGAGWRGDLFDLRARVPRPGDFDDATGAQRLRGVYASVMRASGDWDVYLMEFRDPRARYAQGEGRERRWTAGLRASGARGAWDWNWEAALQGGRFAGQPIRAWTLATETGRRWPQRALSPRMVLKAAIASGDDGDDGRLGTFNPMYPRGNYFGEEATLGPRNFFNLEPGLELRPGGPWELQFSIDMFYRLRTGDGIYAPNGLLLKPPADSRARHVATIYSANACWCASERLSITLVGAYARPGRFLRDTGSTATLRYLELTATVRF